MNHKDKLNAVDSAPNYSLSSHEDTNQRIDEDIFEFCNSCSSTDCTGLIPSAPVEEGSIESYEELYPFLPPHYGLH